MRVAGFFFSPPASLAALMAAFPSGSSSLSPRPLFVVLLLFLRASGLPPACAAELGKTAPESHACAVEMTSSWTTVQLPRMPPPGPPTCRREPMGRARQRRLLARRLHRSWPRIGRRGL
ncbi:unnamed protein product, partial [Prorocentrum cordatum]